jgi:phage tail-like protein
MPNRRSFDHIGNYNFKVEIEGVTQGAFSECGGLEVVVEVVETHDGDTPLVRKRPGRVHYANLVLQRGYTDSTELWDWTKTVLDGTIERKSGSVILLDDTHNEISRYNFFEAWPCRWKGFEFNRSGVGASIEELEIAVEKVERG